jgi:PAS domain S-box-containing protein
MSRRRISKTSATGTGKQVLNLNRLNSVSSRLWRIRDLHQGLQEMLVATIELLGADMGNVQLLDADQGVLAIVAQRGFRQDFLDVFREVCKDDQSACGRVLRSGQRIVIEDVETDPAYATLRSIARAAGYRAVQSTPLVSRDGALLGILSTHFRSPHRPSQQDLQALDLYVRQAAGFIERWRTDEDLHKIEAILRALLETAAQAILTVNNAGRIELANTTAEQMFGYNRTEMLGQPVEMLIPMQFRDIHEDHRADFFMRPRSRPMGIGLDLAGRRKDGSEFPIEVSLSYIESENRIVAVSFITDITDRKVVEKELQAKANSLRESQINLQALAGQLLTAQEEASQNIARELHDVFGQKLALLGLRVSEVEALLPGQQKAAEEKLRSCREQIGVLAQELHDFSRQLHPSVLHELGLEVALRAECDAHAHRNGKTLAFSAENVPEFLSEDISLCLYRVAQESLHNIWKHAGSNRVGVMLRALNEEIELVVEDFGKGFDIESTKGKGGLGLISMQERVRLVGGSLTITTKAGDGTRVQVHVPLRSE